MIELVQLSKWYGQFRVLVDCSLAVTTGEVVVVCGPSGSGKSTLLRIINGLEKFQSGELVLGDVHISPTMDFPRLWRARIAMVFQHFELFPHMTVIQNLTIGPMRVLKYGREQADASAAQQLERVGLLAKRDAYPWQLSGGQKQRVAIARALAMEPRAILFDEPTSALDPEMVHEVPEVIEELAREGTTMIVVSHEMGFARRVAKRIVFMNQGRIEDDCSPDEFFASASSERSRAFLARILPA